MLADLYARADRPTAEAALADWHHHAAALDVAVKAANTLLGWPLIEDCIDAATGEIVPLVVVTDNGPAMKSVAVARWFAALVSGGREPPPPALLEPYVTVSRHTAPAVRRWVGARRRQ